MTLPTIEPLVTLLASLLLYFQNERHRKSDEKKAALLSIAKALDETLKYKEQSKEYQEKDREEEIILSGLWEDAAMKVRAFAPDLYKRLLFKSDIWARATYLPRREVLEKKIALIQIKDELRKLASD